MIVEKLKLGELERLKLYILECIYYLFMINIFKIRGWNFFIQFSYSFLCYSIKPGQSYLSSKMDDKENRIRWKRVFNFLKL